MRQKPVAREPVTQRSHIPFPRSSSMPPPMRESQSTSTQVESNDVRQPTGDSSQADETNSVPLTGVDMVENIKTRCYDLLTVYEGKNDKNHSEASSNPPPSTDNDLGRYALFLNSRKKAWWKSSGLRYPTLQAIARDVLAVPISTVSSESSFSTGGRVVTPNRNRLHPKTLEALMCTQSWLAALENGGEAMPGNPFPTINDDDTDSDEYISDVTCVDD